MRPRDQAPPQGHRHRKMPRGKPRRHGTSWKPMARSLGTPPAQDAAAKTPMASDREESSDAWHTTCLRHRNTKLRHPNKHEAEKFAFTPSTRPVHNAPVRRQPGDEVMRLSFDLRPIDSPQELLLTCPLFFASERID